MAKSIGRHACCPVGACIDNVAASLAHITSGDLQAAIHAATRLNLSPPKFDELVEAVSGRRPHWGPLDSVMKDVVVALMKRMQSPYWVAGAKAALTFHELLWKGQPDFISAVRMLSPPLSSESVPTYSSMGCGQGIKQQNLVRFLSGMSMMLATTLTHLPNTAAVELRQACRAGKYPNLFPIPTTVSTFDLPILSKALDAAAFLNTHINYIASAVDLNFLCFDNPISVTIANRIVHDSKAIFFATKFLFEQIFRIEPVSAYVIAQSDQRAWTSLYQSFVSLGPRFGNFFTALRTLAIEFTEQLPPADKKFDFPKKRMSDYWKSVKEATEAAEAAALGLMPAPAAASTSTRDPAVVSQSSISSSQLPRAETSPLTHSGGSNRSSDGKPSEPAVDTFIDGALTEDDHSGASGSTSITFASYLEASSPQDRYVLGNVLGKGAFGTVYRAFDTDSGTFVAIKELQVAALGDEASLMQSFAELQSEFAILTKLTNPHVVSCFGLEIADRKPRIIMEWMPGGSMQAALKLTRNGFREPVVAKYIKQALEGLQYLHSQNVVHRDIKPGNMLLSAVGDVKLSDFGTSRLVSEITDSMKTGSVVGTIPFLAPECFTGVYSSGSDIWALGCSTLEMLTGRAPWSEASARDALSLVFHIGNAKPPNHHPALPPTHALEPPTPVGASPLVMSNSGTTIRGNLATGSGTISPVARDFLLQCFTYDYKTRPCASDLLKHEFLAHA